MFPFQKLSATSQLGDEIDSLKCDLSEVRSVLSGLIIERACQKIAFGIQDVNASSFLKTSLIVRRKGLSAVFKSLQKIRQDAAHLLLHDDPPHTTIYKKAAFIRILENSKNSKCLQDALYEEGITSEVIAVVLQ